MNGTLAFFKITLFTGLICGIECGTECGIDMRHLGHILEDHVKQESNDTTIHKITHCASPYL